MDRRLMIQAALEEVLGTKNVYYQPPSNVQLSYPCIVYKLTDVDVKYADNRSFSKKDKYMVTVIDRNPDSKFYRRILDFPMCSFDRTYTSENLNHYVLTLYA